MVLSINTNAGVGNSGKIRPDIIAGKQAGSADESLFKDFPISERFRFQFRAECFNIPNTPQYNLGGF